MSVCQSLTALYGTQPHSLSHLHTQVGRAKVCRLFCIPPTYMVPAEVKAIGDGICDGVPAVNRLHFFTIKDHIHVKNFHTLQGDKNQTA